MMENALVGTDVMPAATHLTASVLSSAHPGTPFKDTSIATLPYGLVSGKPLALGALDLIEGKEVMPLLVSQQRVQGSSQGSTESISLPHGSFDLVIMNPPFTRSTNHEATHRNVVNPAFAPFGTTPEIQKKMGNLLKGIRRRTGIAGHGNAGLASDFLDIAHVKVKQGGVIALVLPAVCLSGDSWKKARALLKDYYRDITIFSIAAVGKTDRAFSADTGMAEIMIVAVRNAEKVNQGIPYTYINLHSRPKHILEAVFTARDINRKVVLGEQSGLVKLGTKQTIGNWIRGSSGGYAAVRNLDVAKAAAKLYEGWLPLPKPHDEISLCITQLENLGLSGPLSRDISEKGRSGHVRGPFNIECLETGETPTYPALWRHDAERENKMVVEPDSQCIVRTGYEDRAAKLWEKAASRLHFTQEFQLNSQPLCACLTKKVAIGGRAWPSFVCINAQWEIPLLLWSNTTLGLIAFWWIGSRQQLARPTVSRSIRPSLAVLDASRLSKAQISQANEIFDNFKKREFLPANEAYRDKARQNLDKDMLIGLLGLPESILTPLDRLREQWCSEPTVHGGQDSRPA